MAPKHTFEYIWLRNDIHEQKWTGEAPGRHRGATGEHRGATGDPPGSHRGAPGTPQNITKSSLKHIKAQNTSQTIRNIKNHKKLPKLIKMFKNHQKSPKSKKITKNDRK